MVVERSIGLSAAGMPPVLETGKAGLETMHRRCGRDIDGAQGRCGFLVGRSTQNSLGRTTSGNFWVELWVEFG